MAERRMFAKTIIDSDAFLDMPITAQLLYFHLSMRADDDGFINKPKSIMRMCGCKDDDMKILIIKKFIIPFETGVVVIKHWKIHNYIRNDRYTETKYKDEKSMLALDENKSYKLGIPHDNQLSTSGIPNGYQMDTQVRLGKVSIDKDNIYSLVVAYLNEKAGTKFKASTSKTRTCIHARIEEGFELEDFKTVIDKKCAEWIGDEKMQKFLRPETLFGTKFEGYLNTKVTQRAATVNESMNDLDDIF